MPRKLAAPVAVLAVLLATACGRQAPPAAPSMTPVQRGEYLATLGGCHDCHSPKVFTETGPALDPARLLSGHPASAPLPAIPFGVIAPDRWGALTNAHLTAWAGPWGVSFAANLTPDVTGLGGWSESEFIQALRTGKHAGIGRPILPPMPWASYAKMTDDDLKAVFAYLGSLPPVSNLVPAPMPPSTPQPAPPPPN